MFTLADLTRFTGAKRRSVQLWAEGSAISALPQTEREGSGVHRLFDRDEVVIACVISSFAADGEPIGRLVEVGSRMRTLLSDKGTKGNIYSAIHSSRRVFVIRDQHDLFSIYLSRVEDQFDRFYLAKMNDDNYDAKIVYLGGCLKRLRKVPEFSGTQLVEYLG